MARATHGVHRGAYYWEAFILPDSQKHSHVRIGWCTRQGELQAPVGYDQYSYAYRDEAGILLTLHFVQHCISLVSFYFLFYKNNIYQLL
jgi:hypothetical protein